MDTPPLTIVSVTELQRLGVGVEVDAELLHVELGLQLVLGAADNIPSLGPGLLLKQTPLEVVLNPGVQGVRVTFRIPGMITFNKNSSVCIPDIFAAKNTDIELVYLIEELSLT